jgi:hypothetical protein
MTPSTLWNFLKVLNIHEDLIDDAIDNARAIKDTDIVPGIRVLSRARADADPAVYVQLTLDDTAARMVS